MLVFITIVAVGVATLATAIAGAPRSSAATQRTLTVGPAAGLVDQAVLVHWTGFTPTSGAANTVTVVQCKAAPVSLADCFVGPDGQPDIRPPAGGDPNGSALQDGVTGADGTGAAVMEVRPSLDLPVLGCSEASPCTVLAFENNGQPTAPNALPSTAITAPLHFAPSPSDCPRVGTPDVATLGEESAAPALYGWSASVCTGAKPLALDYTAKGSPEGRRNFLVGNVDVGISSMPATPEEKHAAVRDLAYAPIDLSAVVVAFNVTDAVTKQRITDMNLTPRLVAILLAAPQFGGPGKALFQDPEFVALNPGHNWPQNTQPPALRAERNADAYVLTNWIQHDSAARKFLDGGDAAAPVDPFWKGITYPTDVFESRDPNVQGVYNPRTGTVQNVRRLFNFQPPGDGVTISAGTDALFGVMDVVTATQFGLPMAKLRSADAPNGAFIAPDAAGIKAGSGAMKTNPDGVTKQADPTNTTAYPLVKIDYAMVPTTGIADSVKRAHIAQFLDFAAGPGQQPAALPAAYVPLTPDLQAQDAKARDAVLAQSGVDPRPPVAPTATTTAADQGLSGNVDSGATGTLGANSSATGSSSLPGGNVGTAAAAPSTPVRPAATRRSTSSPNGLAAGLRNFLGGDHQLFLPVLFVLGAVALIAGPIMTLVSQGKLRLRRRRRAAPVRGAVS